MSDQIPDRSDRPGRALNVRRLVRHGSPGFPLLVPPFGLPVATATFAPGVLEVLLIVGVIALAVAAFVLFIALLR